MTGVGSRSGVNTSGSERVKGNSVSTAGGGVGGGGVCFRALGEDAETGTGRIVTVGAVVNFEISGA